MRKYYLHLLINLAIVCGGFGLLLVASRADVQNAEYLSNVLLLVFFAGAAGAVVNNYFRVVKLAEKRKAIASDETDAFVVQMYVSLLVGGTLAFIAYGLFASGL